MIVETLNKTVQTEKREKLCRARGGESCAFDGAMIVLQPIADAVHLVHGPYLAVQIHGSQGELFQLRVIFIKWVLPQIWVNLM